MGKLFDLIPKEELRRICSQKYCELEGDFMGFDEVYEAVTKFVPKRKTISKIQAKKTADTVSRFPDGDSGVLRARCLIFFVPKLNWYDIMRANVKIRR